MMRRRWSGMKIEGALGEVEFGIEEEKELEVRVEY
jgi:hypothetical protein